MFKHLKISLKIGGGFGLVIGLLLIVMGLYQFVVQTAIRGFQDLLHDAVLIDLRSIRPPHRSAEHRYAGLKGDDIKIFL